MFSLLWSSATSTTPTVRWGTASGQLDRVVQATTKTISKSEVCGSPANTTGYRDLGLIHTAALSGEARTSPSLPFPRPLLPL